MKEIEQNANTVLHASVRGMTMESLELVLLALDFAAKRHKDQFRKGEDKPPYINHPIQVANLLVNEAGEKDSALIAAAILHDVVEDTVSSEKEKQLLIDQIGMIFGDEVLGIVLEVTDDKQLPKQERKRLQIEEAPDKSLKAKKLKIADKILNIRDITNFPPVGWNIDRIREYFDWSEKVVAGIRGVNRKLEDMFDATLKRGRDKYK